MRNEVPEPTLSATDYKCTNERPDQSGKVLSKCDLKVTTHNSRPTSEFRDVLTATVCYAWHHNCLQEKYVKVVRWAAERGSGGDSF
jgi:hypothetical protein